MLSSDTVFTPNSIQFCQLYRYVCQTHIEKGRKTAIQAMDLQRNSEVRSQKHCCSGKAMSITQC